MMNHIQKRLAAIQVFEGLRSRYLDGDERVLQTGELEYTLIGENGKVIMVAKMEKKM